MKPRSVPEELKGMPLSDIFQYMRRNGYSFTAHMKQKGKKNTSVSPAIWNLSDANLAADIGIAPNTFRKILANDPSIKWTTVEKSALFFLAELELGSPIRVEWLELIELSWQRLQAHDEASTEHPKSRRPVHMATKWKRPTLRKRTKLIAIVASTVTIVAFGSAWAIYAPAFSAHKFNAPASRPKAPNVSGIAAPLTIETIKYTPEQHNREINLLLKTSLESFKQQNAGSDRLMLSKTIQELKNRRDDPTNGFETFVSKLSDIDKNLIEAANYYDPGKISEAREALRNGELSKAEQVWKAVFETSKMNLGEFSDRAVQAALQLGEIQISDFRWLEGASNFKIAAELAPTIPNLSKAGNFLWRIGDYNGAEHFERQVLKIIRAQSDSFSDELAGAMSSLGVTLAALGKFDEAEHLYLEALEIRRTNLASDDPALIRTVNNYCNSLIAMDRLEEATRYCNEALDVRHAQRNSNPYSYAISLIVTAGLEKKLNNLTTAETYLREAAKIAESDEAYWGPRSARYGQAIYQLGLLLHEMGTSHEAATLIEKSISIVQDLNGELSPDIFIRMSSLAKVRATLGSQHEALAMATHAYTNLELLFADTAHPDVVSAKLNLDLIRDRLQLDH